MTNLGTGSPDIVWNGDSLSAMGGGLTPPVNPAAFLADFTGLTVRTNAVGGETSVGVAARQGGNPYLLLPDGGEIPASGPVVVTVTNANGGSQWPLLQTNGNPTLGKTIVGTLQGVHGTLSLVQPSGASTSHHVDDYYVFTRDTAGTAVRAPRPTPLYLEFATAHRGDIAIIQAGKNDCLQSSTLTHDEAIEQVLDNVAAMVTYLEGGRYLIVGVHNGTGEGANNTTMYPRYVDLNAALQAKYGRRFVDIRDYLIAYGLDDAGIYATAGDTSDIADDTTPRSLLLPDGTHFQIITRQIVAHQVGLRLAELGWATTVTPWSYPVEVVDDFDRPDSTDLGALWSVDGSFKIASDHLTTSSSFTTTAVLTLADGATSADQRVSATVARGTSTSVGLVVRCQDADNVYGVRANNTGNLLIFKVVAGVTTSLIGGNDLWMTDGDVMTLEVIGDTLAAYVNGTQVLQTTDSSLTAAGAVGVRCNSAGATAPTWDDFRAVYLP